VLEHLARHVVGATDRDDRGYGDVTPKNTAGRIVGAIVIMEGIAFLAIIMAAITSTFAARAQAQHETEE
jgi:hypothetical protein